MYTLEFSNGNDDWEIKDVTSDSDDFSQETLDEDFDSETNPSCKSWEEIPKKDFDVLKKYL